MTDDHALPPAAEAAGDDCHPGGHGRPRHGMSPGDGLLLAFGGVAAGLAAVPPVLAVVTGRNPQLMMAGLADLCGSLPGIEPSQLAEVAAVFGASPLVNAAAGTAVVLSGKVLASELGKYLKEQRRMPDDVRHAFTRMYEALMTGAGILIMLPAVLLPAAEGVAIWHLLHHNLGQAVAVHEMMNLGGAAGHGLQAINGAPTVISALAMHAHCFIPLLTGLSEVAVRAARQAPGTARAAVDGFREAVSDAALAAEAAVTPGGYRGVLEKELDRQMRYVSPTGGKGR